MSTSSGVLVVTLISLTTPLIEESIILPASVIW